MKPEQVRSSLFVLLAVPVVALLLVAGLLLWQVNDLLESSEWVAHTNQVIMQADRSFVLLIDMETGLRGYLLTGDLRFLQPYKEADHKIDRAFDQVRTLVSDDHAQLVRMDELGPLVNEWRSYAGRMIALRQSRKNYQDVMLNLEGKAVFDRIRAKTTEILDVERRLRDVRTIRVQQSAHLLKAVTLSALLGIGALIGIVVLRRLNVIATTYDEAIRLKDVQAASLRDNQEQLRSFSGQLEKLVQERTEELMQSQNRLRVLATELNLAEQRERKRLATELHDYLAQLLVVCRINLGHTKRIGLPTKANEILEETEGVLNKALNYCRTLMAELSPPVLQDHGLPAGLQWLGQQMQRHGLVVTVDLGEMSDHALPDDCTMLLFQSVRELLMNTLKHAATDKVGIRLAQKDGTLRIEVRDEGVGFDLAAALTATTATDISSKFGLFSINERMKALGGWFDVYSVPGKGTTATLILPIEGMDAMALNGERHASSAHAGTLTHTPTAVSAPGHVLTADASPEDLSGPKQPVIRLLLVDDHAMVRQGLRSVLESYPDIMVVGEASNGEEAVASAGLLQPSIVVMDINMPRMNGIEATAQIKARYPHIRVIGLSVQAGGANEVAMRKAGAGMLLTKETAVDQLYRAIQTTLSEV